MLKTVLIGSVQSSAITLNKLVEHGANLVAVFGLREQNNKNVSGYVNLEPVATKFNIPYYAFDSVKDDWIEEKLREIEPDIIFVVGLSQLVPDSFTKMTKWGIIGFHPTLLPHARGRAPIAWLILREKIGAATFFKISDGIDNGPIFVQKPYELSENDDVSSVLLKINKSIEEALDDWLPRLLSGDFSAIDQNDESSYYYAKRTPLDGIIDWYLDINTIERIIKAASSPHPGAYTFLNDYKVIIWDAEKILNHNTTGVIGRIVSIDDDCPVVQANNGWMKIKRFDVVDVNNNTVKISLNIGNRLGYYEQYEIFRLRNRLNELAEKIDNILKIKS